MSKFIFASVATGSYFKFDATTYYLSNLTLSETADKIDVTDTATTGDGKEYVYGRRERTFSAELFMTNLSASAEPALATRKAIEISFEGRKYIGSGSLESKEITGAVDSAIAVSFNGTFDGAVSTTP